MSKDSPSVGKTFLRIYGILSVEVRLMDPVKFGKNLSSLRRREGLTQEALGEKIGVTNKTVSRWENGNNLPDIEMLQVLGDIFHVSVDQLISGGEQAVQKSPCAENRKRKKSERFSHDEKHAYWKKKWLQEHISGIILVYLFFAALFVLAIVRKKVLLVALSPMLWGVLYAYFRNQMMIYIEDKIFGL